MKKKSIILLAVLAITCTLAKAQVMKPVVIAGKVINLSPKSPQTIKFNFCNPLIDGSITAKLDSNGRFNVKQDMLYTQNMTFFYAVSFIYLYVQPGDSVFLTIDAAKLNKPKFGWINIRGSHARLSSQLNLVVDTLYKISTAEINLSQKPADMLAAVKTDYARYITALDEYTVNHKLDPIITTWAKRDLKLLLSNAIGSYTLPRDLSKAERLARNKVFSDKFFDVHNADNFQSMMFRYHLINYGLAIVAADAETGKLAELNQLTKSLKRAVAQLLREQPGDSRDFMIYHQLQGYAKASPKVLDSIPEAGQWFTRAVYYQQFKKWAEGIRRPIFTDVAIEGVSYADPDEKITALPKTDVLKYLAKKHPGKAIYIDVYATWCGPCIEEIKQTPPVHRAMQDKDVVFVNLCLASEINSWRKFIKERNLHGENFFFTNDASQLFMSNYKLHGYPSYILINKKGNVVTTSAPRPSEFQILKERLNKLAAE